MSHEKIISEANIYSHGTVTKKSTQVVELAEDINILEKKLRDVKEAFLVISDSASKIGLHINEDKTKMMTLNIDRSNEKHRILRYMNV